MNTQVYRLDKQEKKLFNKELLALAIPVGIQNLLVSLIGATDALLLGRLTQDAVSAVSLANQVVFIMQMFVMAAVGGGSVLIAQYWGKGDKVMAKNLFCTILKYTFAISLVFFAVAMLIPDKLMRIFTPETAIVEIGTSYLRIVSVSYLFSGVTQCYYLMMKMEGKASKSVVISVVMLVTDVVLDIFLIYGLGNWQGLGADGSACSTVAVEAVALIWCIVESHRGESIHPDWAGFKWFSSLITKDLLKVALPTLASALAWGLSISVHNVIMGHLGSDATAAASITSVVQEVVNCVAKGIAVGSGIMVGKLLGQDRFDEAKAYGRRFWYISFLVGGIHMVLLGILGPIMAAFFVLTETAKQYLLVMLIFSAFYLFAYSMNTIFTGGVLPAGGDAKYDAISLFFATWCFAIPVSTIGAFVFNWPVLVVYIVMCADEIVKLPWLYWRYKKYYWVKNLTRDNPE